MTTSFNIPPSQSTPAISADWDAGVLAISGDSYPENSFDFFTATIEWIESFLAASGNRALRLDLSLVYMNTSSVKAMMDIFDLLEEAHAKGRAVSVDWYYDPRNERVEILAEEFREDCSFPFNITARN
ncbi:DUF1987 domain-containing protein [Pseudothauera nasutitermitis]|uniref:DUF1987 domain-containing protein n=1 Tax=Pseudothauera nasutitermitis TaxID=2565930 RepID=A0A4S4B1I4_9RHOO|nr:biofilm regulation phosphoprotein SiaC [Pseudothauera nasutitermitis]THF65537.1 DUF1987 domain-containing protein [Pseudothauera nasutitermitis]